MAYEPFGETWKAQAAHAKKAELIEMLARKGKRLDEAEALMREAIDNCETGDCARCRTFADWLKAS